MWRGPLNLTSTVTAIVVQQRSNPFRWPQNLTVFQTRTEANKQKFDTFTKILILSQIPTYYFKEFITNKAEVRKK